MTVYEILDKIDWDNVTDNSFELHLRQILKTAYAAGTIDEKDVEGILWLNSKNLIHAFKPDSSLGQRSFAIVLEGSIKV